MNGLLLQITESAATTFHMGSGNVHQDILMLTLIVVMVVVLIAAIILLKAFKTIIHVTMPEVEKEAKVALLDKRRTRKESRRDWWNKLMGLRPIAEEEDLVIDHSYDGIRELDNPTPVWFMGLFYASIVFGVVYLSVYHVFGWGMSQVQEYENEMLVAETKQQAYLASRADNVDENTVELDKSAETIIAGKAIFDQNCVACHGSAGEGGIGPNLTDNYWLHGGGIKHIFKTIKQGVPEKGMIAWEQQLSPAQIAQVSNYIISLNGSNPANPKAPQGELVEVQQEEKVVLK